MKIAVLTDSGSNYYNENINREGLYCVSLQVITFEKGLRDGLEISSVETYQLIEKGLMLKTSGPIVQDIQDVVQKIKKDGYDSVYCVNITNGLSSTIATVKMVVEQEGLSYFGIDCYTTARVQLECAMKAREMFNQGHSVKEVQTVLQHMINHSITIVIPTDMKHLQRGGRLTPMAAKLAGLLKITPILYLNQETEGKIESYKKVRTMKKAMNSVVEHFLEKKIDSTYKICIAHVLAKETADEMANLLSSKIPNLDMYIVDLVSVVGVHTGLGCLALQYVKK